MARRSSDLPRRAGLVAVAVALGAALVASRARVARTIAAVRQPDRARVADTYRCDCGAEYRVAGVDRHRVFWPAGAPDDAPVLGDRCPACDAVLPAGREAALT
jgi:hypothetical protein